MKLKSYITLTFGPHNVLKPKSLKFHFIAFSFLFFLVQNALHLVYLGVLVLISAWIGMYSTIFWFSLFAIAVLASCISKMSNFPLYMTPTLLIHDFTGVAFWMHTGERQTARLRIKYIQSVLNQHMSFFDTDSTKQNVLQHLSNDAILVQDAIGDKVQKL